MSDMLLRLLTFVLGAGALLAVMYIFIKNQPPHWMNVALGLFAVAFVAMGMDYNLVVERGADGSFVGRLEQVEKQLEETSGELNETNRKLATTNQTLEKSKVDLENANRELTNTRQSLKTIVQTVSLVQAASPQKAGGIGGIPPKYTTISIDAEKWRNLQLQMVRTGVLKKSDLPKPISQTDFAIRQMQLQGLTVAKEDVKKRFELFQKKPERVG